MKVCIVGQGYIGLPTAALFTRNHCEVVGVDVNEEISINNKIKHISDFISSLLKIKRTLIGQKNNDNLEQLPK